MSDRNNIDENGLDDLLRDYALNKGADDSLADAVMSQDYDVPVDKTKEEALLNKLNKNIKGGNNFRPFLYGAIVVVLVGALAMYAAAKKKTKENQSYITPGSAANNGVGVESGAIAVNVGNDSLLNQATRPDTFGKINSLVLSLYTDSVETKAEPIPMQNNVQKQASLPFLTEKDRLRYTKVKQQMLEKLYKTDKALYTHIASNKTDYVGKPVVVDGFTIRNVAITNLEYKTFLADLLIQNRAEEYFKSEVLSMKWKTEGYDRLAYEYFQDERYNDFPVVNVSVAGARTFCKWLDDEIKIYIQQNKLKGKSPLVRLPSDKEWILAARDGYAKISYDTGYNTIYEIREGLVDFSFVKRMNQIRKKNMSKDTLYPLYITNRYGWPEQKLKDFLGKGLGAYSYLPADTIYPDRMKVYGKIGHVSELVIQESTERVWLTGLTWTSKEEYQAFETKFKAAGVSPFVSFRIVVIDPEDPTYKNPFW